MTFDKGLIAVCAAAAAFVLWRLGRYVADGGGRRSVRVPARVVRVREPAKEGAFRAAGIPAEIAFVAPDTGRETVLGTGGRRGGRLDAAWLGRRVEVRYPPGRPEQFRVVTGPRAPDRDQVALAVGLFVPVAALVARFTTEGGFHAALVGFGVLWAAGSATVLVLTAAERARRRARLAARDITAGQVVAVLASRYDTDEAPGPGVVFTPVVTFTTRDGHLVTAVCPFGSSGRRDWTGREVGVRYARSDPSVISLGLLGDRLLAAGGLLLLVFFLAFGAALTAVGLLLS
ncbi:hypothetical protein [Streptomyces sp. CA-111067]|uniref:hypothetical protein n=1 Tax=Streptomyces sp. CA-111067 TaxID=3240046 RepID=UPI003D95ECDD